jgi:endoglucanase
MPLDADSIQPQLPEESKQRALSCNLIAYLADSLKRRERRAVGGWCLALALSLTVTASAGCAGQSASQARLALRVSGNEFVNEEGKPTRLLGVNRSGAEYACIQGWRVIDGPIGERSIAAMRSWRINAVRLPLNEDCWLGINGVPARYGGARYREVIRAYVARLNHAGLYVILDLHWSAPGRVRATGQQPMADLAHAPAFWSSVARMFRVDPAILFDLYNEPYGISWRCWRDGCILPQGWRTAGMQTLVDAVRSTGARQPIIAAGIGSGNDLSSWLRYRPHDPANQLVAGMHAYSFLNCVTVACWSANVEPVAGRVPVVATELGEADCTAKFVNRFMNWADSAGVSYLGWTWNPSGCGAPALIRSWDGQPTSYGEGLRVHLIKLYSERGAG